MLDTHSEVYGGPEFDHTPSFLRLRDSLHRSIDNNRIDSFLDKTDVDRIIESALIESLECRRKGQFSIISEKTPWNALWFSKLMDVFPEAQFINVVRDPRGVVSSMLDVGRRAKKQGKRSPGFTRNVFLANEIIKTVHAEADKALQKAPERVLTVRYEAFLDEPDAVSQRMCDFLELRWEPKMAKPHEVDHDVDKVAEKRAPPFLNWDTYKSPPDRKVAKKWKSDLGSLKREIVQNEGKSVFEKYGYELLSNNKVQIITGRTSIVAYREFKKLVFFSGKAFRRLGNSLINRVAGYIEI